MNASKKCNYRVVTRIYQQFPENLGELTGGTR